MGRRHGFQCLWGPHQVRSVALSQHRDLPCLLSLDKYMLSQVVALVLYLYLLLAFYILTAPFLPSSPSHVAFQVLYGLLAAVVLAVGVAAT